MKSAVLIVVLTGMLSSVQAQMEELPFQRFGFKVAVNYGSMNFNKGYVRPNPATKNIWKAGLSIGFITQVPINDFLTFQPEYAYSQMHGEDERINATYKLDYLSLPVLLKISLGERFAVVAGPQFDLLISAKEKRNGSNSTITHDTEERGIAGVVGVQFNVIQSLYVDARYLKGFNHVGLNDRQAINEFKWDVFSLGVGVRF